MSRLATKPIVAPEQLVQLGFPRAGMDLSAAFWAQHRRQIADNEWAPTCRLGINVRAYEPGTFRARGGSRPGLAKWNPSAIVPDWIVQDLNLIVGKGYTAPSGSVQSSQSGRIVTVVAVSQGQVYSAQSGDTVWTPAVNATGLNPPLAFSGVIFSAANNQKLWFADGANWAYFQPSDNTVRTWAPSAGSLPVDSQGNLPRLIATWRGRTVLSGLLKDSQNWFMSALFDPTNFDYSPVSTNPGQAIRGTDAPQGLIGDVITCLIPYSDDVLVVGGDHTIYMMSGDPMAGGQIDLVSDSIGMAFGQPWARDPYGTVYFFSNRTGIYSFVPGQQPVRISQQIEQFLQVIDTGSNSIRMLWDDRFQGLHVYVTRLDAPRTAVHFFWEHRVGAWWLDVFGNNNLNPVAACIFDGNTPGDRVPLIGSWDGFVRSLTATATDDDGTPISSSVVLGPIVTSDTDDMLLKDIQGVLGDLSGPVNYNVFIGTTAESALGLPSVSSGTWQAGRNASNIIRRAGHAVYLQLSATNPWSLELVKARIAGQGKVRRRGKF